VCPQTRTTPVPARSSHRGPSAEKLLQSTAFSTRCTSRGGLQGAAVKRFVFKGHSQLAGARPVPRPFIQTDFGAMELCGLVLPSCWAIWHFHEAIKASLSAEASLHSVGNIMGTGPCHCLRRALHAVLLLTCAFVPQTGGRATARSLGKCGRARCLADECGRLQVRNVVVCQSQVTAPALILRGVDIRVKHGCIQPRADLRLGWCHP